MTREATGALIDRSFPSTMESGHTYAVQQTFTTSPSAQTTKTSPLQLSQAQVISIRELSLEFRMHRTACQDGLSP